MVSKVVQNGTRLAIHGRGLLYLVEINLHLSRVEGNLEIFMTGNLRVGPLKSTCEAHARYEMKPAKAGVVFQSFEIQAPRLSFKETYVRDTDQSLFFSKGAEQGQIPLPPASHVIDPLLLVYCLYENTKLENGRVVGGGKLRELTFEGSVGEGCLLLAGQQALSWTSNDKKKTLRIPKLKMELQLKEPG